MKILILYTGGTFGMIPDEDGTLRAINFRDLSNRIPEINHLGAKLEVVSSSEILDSSAVGPTQWLEYNQIIQSKYESYNAFLILHGTDTMAYTASALSFLLAGTKKPVVLTGAQIPLGTPRNDARDNLIGALSILVSGQKEGVSLPEVCIYFNHKLLRGSRAVKVESEDFKAFESYNYPELAEVGINVKFNTTAILKKSLGTFAEKLSNNVTVLTFYPGILDKELGYYFNYEKNKIVIVQSFGSGNFPVNNELKKIIQEFISKKGIVLNVSQCIGGNVIQKKYEIGYRLEELGVLGMSDITLEACVTKSMYALANIENKNLKSFLTTSYCGEMSTPE